MRCRVAADKAPERAPHVVEAVIGAHAAERGEWTEWKARSLEPAAGDFPVARSYTCWLKTGRRPGAVAYMFVSEGRPPFGCPEEYVFSDASRSHRFIFVDQATEDIDPADAWRVG